MSEIKPEISSTEEKIMEAARKVFLRKGYAGTRTRDITLEAGINHALLNYYFRSKQKLFEAIMQEKIVKFLGNLIPLVNDETTSPEQKIQLIVENYIEMLQQNPDLPIFVLSELQKGNFEAIPIVNVVKDISNSSFFRQVAVARPDINPAHFFLTMVGMIIFPFVARPFVELSGLVSHSSFNAMMEERKILITSWMKTIIHEKPM